MQSYTKMRSTRYNDVIMKVIPGHFVTPNSHINYYIDMTTMKTRQNEAKAAARAMSEDYVASTVVDTIVCMDGMEVIGAYMAEELTKAGIMSMNAHKTIYIMSPCRTDDRQGEQPDDGPRQTLPAPFGFGNYGSDHRPRERVDQLLRRNDRRHFRHLFRCQQGHGISNTRAVYQCRPPGL